ncbi:MAG: hypothetical protein JNK82_17145 [Myxococcaceae bacterium]|nr:hypothetical protein [Myxococcaceae bacterium]
MSRSTLTFFIAAELLFASAVLAAPKPGRVEKCMANCDAVVAKMEKSCKAQMPGGRCDGRGRAIVDEVEKSCRDNCEKKRNKK